MKKWILAVALTTAVLSLRAQNFDEWFNQKETQTRYLEEQIAAFKSYGATVQKGYKLVRDGLKAVALSKKGDFKLHSRQFLSLCKVKPAIRSSGTVYAIFNMDEEVEKHWEVIQPLLSIFLTPGEITYASSVCKNLLTGCNELVDDLHLIIADDRLSLKDDERIERIKSIYIQMLDRYTFSRSFENELKLRALNKLKESSEVNQFSNRYEIK